MENKIKEILWEYSDESYDGDINQTAYIYSDDFTRISKDIDKLYNGIAKQRELLIAFYDYCKEDIECDTTEITDLNLYIDSFLDGNLKRK